MVEEASGPCSICCARLVGHSVPAMGDLPSPSPCLLSHACVPRSRHTYIIMLIPMLLNNRPGTPAPRQTRAPREGGRGHARLTSSPHRIPSQVPRIRRSGGFSNVRPFPSRQLEPVTVAEEMRPPWAPRWCNLVTCTAV
jgi:hypothetical protein